MTSYLIRDAYLLIVDGDALGTLETGDVRRSRVTGSPALGGRWTARAPRSSTDGG